MPVVDSTFVTTHWTESNAEFQYSVELPAAHSSLSKLPKAKGGNFGQYAKVTQIAPSTFELIRDPLGIGKLFYTQDSSKQLHFAETFIELLPFNQQIFSSPRGMHVRLNTTGLREQVSDLSPQPPPPNTLNVKVHDENFKFKGSEFAAIFQETLQKRLLKAFELIKHLETEGHQIFIALSGGLDSSIIANLAKIHLKNPIACTLDLGASEDATQGTKIAQLLGLKHLLFPTTETEILDAVEQSPELCQDYRDFNVHCTALNILLAKSIKQWADNNNINESKRIILTGDLMNEFTCDYAEEKVGKTIYYRLPRVDTKMLQRQLIGGLDTSDRERYPFKKFGLTCIQPYSITYDLYASLPQHILQEDDIKNTLNAFLVPKGVIELQPKSKLRAQVGDKNSMGVLGLCHREGINEHHFMKKLLANNLSQKNLIPIMMGRYTTESFQ